MAQVKTDYRIGVKDETAKGISSVKKSLAGLSSSFAALGAGISVAAIGAFTVKTAKAADDINKLSDRLGIGTEALSEFKFVAQQSGLEFKTFGTALQRAIRRVSDAAEETGPAVDAFRELGINAKELTKLNPAQTFDVLAEALSRVDDEYKRVSLAQKIFDSEGVALLQTMTEGAAGVQELRKQFRDLGGTLDESTAQIGTNLVDAFGRIDAAGQALGNNLLKTVGPVLVDIINVLSNLIPQAAAFSVRAFEGLRFVIAGFFRDIANFVGLEDIAISLDNVAEQAKNNVIALAQEMENFGKQVEDAKQASDFLSDSLGEQQLTIKQAAEAAAEAAKKIKELADAEKQFSAEFDKANEKLERQEQALLSVATPVEELQILIARFNREQEDFGISAEVTARRVTAAYERISEGVTNNVDEVKTKTQLLLEDINAEIDSFSNSITSALTDTSKTIGDIFKDIASQILKLGVKQLVADPFSNFLKGGLKDFFAGGKADGGFIPPGMFGLVGERGPELAFGGRTGQTISPMNSGVNLVINNFSESQVEQPKISQIDGQQQIELTVRNAVGASVASGGMRPLGLAPPLTRR